MSGSSALKVPLPEVYTGSTKPEDIEGFLNGLELNFLADRGNPSPKVGKKALEDKQATYALQCEMWDELEADQKTDMLAGNAPAWLSGKHAGNNPWAVGPDINVSRNAAGQLNPTYLRNGAYFSLGMGASIANGNMTTPGGLLFTPNIMQHIHFEGGPGRTEIHRLPYPIPITSAMGDAIKIRANREWRQRGLGDEEKILMAEGRMNNGASIWRDNYRQECHKVKQAQPPPTSLTPPSPGMSGKPESNMIVTTPGITFDQLSDAIINSAAAMNLDKKPRGTTTTTTSRTSIKAKVTETKPKITPGVRGGSSTLGFSSTGCFHCRKEIAGHVVSNCPEREEAEEGSSTAAVTNGNEASDSDEDNANYNSDGNVVKAISERIQRNSNSDSDDSDDDFVSAISRAFLEESFVVAVSKARLAELDFILTAHLKKHSLNVLIDTGSASSFVSRKFIKKFRVRYHKLEKPRSYTQASKGAFETTAYVKGRIDNNYGKFGPSELEIADLNRNFDAIIGRNSILQHPAIAFKYLFSRGGTARTKKELNPTQKPATKKGNGGDEKITSVGRTLPLSSLTLKKKVVASVAVLKEALEYEGELLELD
ncbi:hypothetical protein HDV00_000643, partial [Rhizophlyctis rosea]